MVILGGWAFLMSEVPLYMMRIPGSELLSLFTAVSLSVQVHVSLSVQGYLAHKKTLTPL